MMVSEINNTENDYKLFSYLAADLHRARQLVIGMSVIDDVSQFRLWIGVFSPRFIPVLLYRLAYHFYLMRLTPVSKLFSLLNTIFFGIEIAIRCRIGKGLFFPHTHGTVIGAFSIGENAIIFQGVTLGARDLNFSFTNLTRPVVGSDVTIGSGAKVLGGVTLGSGCTIGANAVVVRDINQNALAVGIPAKEITRLKVNEV